MDQIDTYKENKHLWDRFCRLGEMIGDGLADEPDGKWISREYKHLRRILIPEIREAEGRKRAQKNKQTDKRIEQLLIDFRCKCGDRCKQVRSGSLIVECECGKRYKAKKTNNKRIK